MMGACGQYRRGFVSVCGGDLKHSLLCGPLLDLRCRAEMYRLLLHLRELGLLVAAIIGVGAVWALRIRLYLAELRPRRESVVFARGQRNGQPQREVGRAPGKPRPAAEATQQGYIDI